MKRRLEFGGGVLRTIEDTAAKRDAPLFAPVVVNVVFQVHGEVNHANLG